MNQTNGMNKRLESLDILRGFDLLFLVLLSSPIHCFANAVHSKTVDTLMWGFSHVQWTGFSPWDLIMPLFMFMAGVAIPFSLTKYRDSSNKGRVYKRIFKRFVLLWIFGMMCQGHLLDFNPQKISFFSNTLQAIAIGYLFASILYLNVSVRTMIIIAVSCLLAYWGAMEFITAGGFGGGNYTPDGNLAEWIDRTVLGRFRDGAGMKNGTVVFAESNRYTWLLSSLNFTVTVMSGLFAGLIIRKESSPLHKVKTMLVIGIALVAGGWLWNLEQPVIKKLWTSSMTLVSSGYCFLLMAVFYYIVDYKQWKKGLSWLKILGMNSITAYMLANVISFRCIGASLFYGLEQYLGGFYSMLMAICNSTCIFLILLIMYKRKIFLKV